MSESTPEESAGSGIGIGDDQLPEDLVPGEDNPLAEGLDPDERPDDLFDAGKTAEQNDDEDDETESD